MSTAAASTGAALRDAARETRAAWTPWGTVAVVLAALAAVAPAALSGAVPTDTLASGAYLALAATGLAFCVGLAGVPSLAQGAFVGTGAFVAAHLLRHTSLPGEVCALLGAVAAAILGTAAGLAVRSLDAVRVAVSTWLLSWLVALALTALPWLSGGAQGLVVPTRRLFGFEPTPLLHYELGVALTGLCALALFTLRRAPFGIELAAAAEHRPAAIALGVPVERLRVGAFAASALVGGLAGGLAVQLDIVADPGAYGPLVSFELLVAVLVGGAAAALGPSAGVVVLGVIALAARALGDVAAVSASRFQPMLEALLVLAVLATGGSALVPAVRRLAARRLAAGAAAAASATPLPRPEPTTLVAHGLTKRFGAVVAADGVSLELRPGAVTALVGPNGSGKTTVLRLLAGTLPPDSGTIALGGKELTRASVADRVGAGVVRTLQTRSVFESLTVLENVLVGIARRRRDGGAIRALTATPRFRTESRAAAALARGALVEVGLAAEADRHASELTGAQRRRLMIAAALATNPAVLLLDEPAAGAGAQEVEELARLLEQLKAEQRAILLVEHNPALVAAAADAIVELEAGQVVRTDRL